MAAPGAGGGASPQIAGIRILPTMAIARFGSSPSPMDNYDLVLPSNPDGSPNTDYRAIVPAETLLVDAADGSVKQSFMPPEVRFRDAEGRIRPVSPFLEVWVLFAGQAELVPLTADHLKALGLTPADLRWRATAANLKPFRRTGDPGDRTHAETGWFSDHEPHGLSAGSPHFKPGKRISFGSIRYLRPTANHPELRARFTPGVGQVFGPRKGDPLVSDDVYAGQTSGDLGYGGLPSGFWDRYYIGNPGAPPVTAPGDIFQGTEIGSSSDRSNWVKLSSGYLDDSCDGILEVSFTAGGKSFSAYARFASAVPDFAPDCLPVRSIADDLEQMILGPAVAPPTDAAAKAELKHEVEDIIRRGLETVRQMNTSVMNGDQSVADVRRNGNNMPGQETGYGRAFEPVFPNQNGPMEYFDAVKMHAMRLDIALSSTSLETAFQGGMGIMRKPEDVGNLRSEQRRHMPALMRGNEGLELVLTRRQLAKLALADGAQPAAAAAGVAAAAAKPQSKLATYRVMRPLRSEPNPEG